MPGMILRSAVLKDIDALEKLEELCFPEEPWSRQMLLEEIRNPLAFFCVTESSGENDQPVSEAEISGNREDSCKTESGHLTAYMIAWMIAPFECQIGSIAVHPSYRRQGLACRMMDALFEECRKLSIDEASLEVRVSNAAAIALYERYGFVNSGIRKHYYQDGEDAYNMIRMGI